MGWGPCPPHEVQKLCRGRAFRRRAAWNYAAAVLSCPGTASDLSMGSVISVSFYISPYPIILLTETERENSLSLVWFVFVNYLLVSINSHVPVPATCSFIFFGDAGVPLRQMFQQLMPGPHHQHVCSCFGRYELLQLPSPVPRRLPVSPVKWSKAPKAAWLWQWKTCCLARDLGGRCLDRSADFVDSFFTDFHKLGHQLISSIH